MTKGVRWTEEQLRDFQRRLLQPEPAAKPLKTSTESKIERRFAQQLADNPDIPPHQRNYFFLADRDLELDFAWAPLKVAVEVQGMAHRIKGKFMRDLEKRALAMLAGWCVLEVGGDQVRSGLALEWLKILLEIRGRDAPSGPCKPGGDFRPPG
jgi:hypothetical protein